MYFRDGERGSDNTVNWSTALRSSSDPAQLAKVQHYAAARKKQRTSSSADWFVAAAPPTPNIAAYRASNSRVHFDDSALSTGAVGERPRALHSSDFVAGHLLEPLAASHVVGTSGYPSPHDQHRDDNLHGSKYMVKTTSLRDNHKATSSVAPSGWPLRALSEVLDSPRFLSGEEEFEPSATPAAAEDDLLLHRLDATIAPGVSSPESSRSGYALTPLELHAAAMAKHARAAAMAAARDKETKQRIISKKLTAGNNSPSERKNWKPIPRWVNPPATRSTQTDLNVERPTERTNNHRAKTESQHPVQKPQFAESKAHNQEIKLMESSEEHQNCSASTQQSPQNSPLAHSAGAPSPSPSRMPVRKSTWSISPPSALRNQPQQQRFPSVASSSYSNTTELEAAAAATLREARALLGDPDPSQIGGSQGREQSFASSTNIADVGQSFASPASNIVASSTAVPNSIELTALARKAAIHRATLRVSKLAEAEQWAEEAAEQERQVNIENERKRQDAKIEQRKASTETKDEHKFEPAIDVYVKQQLVVEAIPVLASSSNTVELAAVQATLEERRMKRIEETISASSTENEPAALQQLRLTLEAKKRALAELEQQQSAGRKPTKTVTTSETATQMEETTQSQIPLLVTLPSSEKVSKSKHGDTQTDGELRVITVKKKATNGGEVDKPFPTTNRSSPTLSNVSTAESTALYFEAMLLGTRTPPPTPPSTPVPRFANGTQPSAPMTGHHDGMLNGFQPAPDKHQPKPRPIPEASIPSSRTSSCGPPSLSCSTNISAPSIDDEKEEESLYTTQSQRRTMLSDAAADLLGRPREHPANIGGSTSTGTILHAPSRRAVESPITSRVSMVPLHLQIRQKEGGSAPVYPPVHPAVGVLGTNTSCTQEQQQNSRSNSALLLSSGKKSGDDPQYAHRPIRSDATSLYRSQLEAMTQPPAPLQGSHQERIAAGSSKLPHHWLRTESGLTEGGREAAGAFMSLRQEYLKTRRLYKSEPSTSAGEDSPQQGPPHEMTDYL